MEGSLKTEENQPQETGNIQQDNQNLKGLIDNMLKKKKDQQSYDLNCLDGESDSVKRLLKTGARFDVHNKKDVIHKCSQEVGSLVYRMEVSKQQRWFDLTIIFLIFCNSIFMATFDYNDRDGETFRNYIVETSGAIFSVCFMFECALKIIGMGFIFHPNAYLRDGWNWIDFIVVVISIIESIPGIPNMKALRTLRVLRPLRSINAVPSMKRLITALISSLPALANVVLFMMFMFILFGILGVQQYNGAFYNRCRMTETPEREGYWRIDPEIDRLCTQDGSGMFTCPADRWCGSPLDYGITLEQEKVYNQAEIFYGIVTFDNIGIGMISIFQIITLEGWTDMMYDLMDTQQVEFSAIFFCLMVLVGSFFMLQLILAVIMDTFNNFDKEQQEEKDKQYHEQLKQHPSKDESKLQEDREDGEVIHSQFEDDEDDIQQRAISNKFYYVFYRIAIHQIFGGFIIILILGNTVSLALDKYPIEQENYNTLEIANTTFSWLFFAEMIIKLIGLGFSGYARDRFNLFDCVIVIFSTIEMVMELASPGGGGGGGAISAFRGVRLLRVFKLARSWKSFQEILIKIGNSMKDISNFSVLLALFIFIYALLGMELFAYRIKFNDNDEVDENGISPRTNFDEFKYAIITIFIVLIGEDWNNVMYAYVRATNSLAIGFFMSLMILGNLVLLNLFLAILLKNFEEEVIIEDDEEDITPTKEKILARIKNKLCRICKKKEVVEDEFETKPAMTTDAELMESERKLVEKQQISEEDEEYEEDKKEEEKEEKEEKRVIHIKQSGNISQNISFRNKPEVEVIIPTSISLSGYALFLLSPKNPIRKICQKIVVYKYFDPFILLMISFSTILLAMETPLDDPNGSKAYILKKIDIVVSTIFTVELVLKVLTVGFMFCGSTSYIRNPWNILDFIIVTFSIISLSFSQVNLKFIKVLRMLRVLRPLRMISRNEGLKVAVLCLINSMPDIGNVMVISLLFFLLFGIFGLTYFKGTFFSCVMGNIPLEFQDLVTDRWQCTILGGEWMNKDANFDNIQSSVLTLFEMSSTEGWIDMMWDGVDNTGLHNQPKYNASFIWVIFFCMFLVVGSLFVLNLFVGVVINTFNGEKEKLGKNYLLTESQREWVQIQLLCFKSKPLKRPQMTGNVFRDFSLNIVLKPMFDHIIISCIILNTFVLGLKWYDDPEWLAPILEIINYIFALIFTIEAILKISGLGKNYFQDAWNNFDFIIVIGTLIGIILGLTTQVSVGPETTLIRAFRIGRIFRLVKKAKQLRMIFNAFVITMPSLANVGGLLVMLLYLYAVLGVFLFAPIKLQDTVNVHANFLNFGNAFLTLIRAATGEAWNYIMHDCMRERTVIFDCQLEMDYEDYLANGKQTNGCGSQTVALFYFVSFLLIVTLVFLNLFIAIILEGFGNTSEAENMKIPESTIEQFRAIWSDYDNEGKGFIRVEKLSPLILKLVEEGSELFHFKKILKTSESRNKFIKQLRIPCYRNFTSYHYLDVLNSLCKQNISISFQREKIGKHLNNLSIKEKEEFKMEDFDGVIGLIENKGSKEKIAMVEQFKKLHHNQTKKHKGQMDQFEGMTFDSEHIILIPKLQELFREILRKNREIKNKKNNTEWQKNENEEQKEEQKEELKQSVVKEQRIPNQKGVSQVKGQSQPSIKNSVISQEAVEPHTPYYNKQAVVPPGTKKQQNFTFENNQVPTEYASNEQSIKSPLNQMPQMVFQGSQLDSQLSGSSRIPSPQFMPGKKENISGNSSMAVDSDPSSLVIRKGK